MYTLDRCSESLYEPDVGLIKIAEAARHFRPQAGQSLARRPMEYYRSLVNYGASLLTNARYDEADSVYVELNQLVESYPGGTFPRLDYPKTNELLVKYRLGKVSAEDAVRRQREVIKEHLVAGDPFYAENALAVYLSLAGSHSDAEEVYERLDARLSTRKEPEVSMLYLIRANRCSVRFVMGPDDTVADEWNNLEPVVRAIPYVKGRFLIRRHEMLTTVIEEQREMSAHEFDECLILAGPNEFGRMWNQLGRGFRMPEIHWWH